MKNDEVYVLMEHDAHNGDFIVGVFTEKQKAQDFIDNLYETHPHLSICPSDCAIHTQVLDDPDDERNES